MSEIILDETEIYKAITDYLYHEREIHPFRVKKVCMAHETGHDNLQEIRVIYEVKEKAGVEKK